MTVNSTRDFIPPEPFEGQNYKPRYARPSASLREELILTTGNESPILVYYVWVTFSDLEEQKHQKLSIKTQHWRAR